MQAILGGDRKVVLARELTKMFETIIDAPLEALINQLQTDTNQQSPTDVK